MAVACAAFVHGCNMCGILPWRPLSECPAAASLLPGREPRGGDAGLRACNGVAAAAGTHAADARPPQLITENRFIIISQIKQPTKQTIPLCRALASSELPLGANGFCYPQYCQMSVPKNANSGNCHFALFQPLFGSVLELFCAAVAMKKIVSDPRDVS